MLVELLFEKWWMPALVSPAEYGIIVCTGPEDAYTTTILSIIKMMKAVLYNRPLEGRADLITPVNNYVASKS